MKSKEGYTKIEEFTIVHVELVIIVIKKIPPHVFVELTNSHVFFPRIDGPNISTKLGTKHPWVKGIEVSFFFFSNEGPHSFLRDRDNNEIAKIN